MCHIREVRAESLPGIDSDCESPASPSSSINPVLCCPVPRPALPCSPNAASPTFADALAAPATQLPAFGTHPCSSLRLAVSPPSPRRSRADLPSGRSGCPNHPHASGGQDPNLAPRVLGDAGSSGCRSCGSFAVGVQRTCSAQLLEESGGEFPLSHWGAQAWCWQRQRGQRQILRGYEGGIVEPDAFKAFLAGRKPARGCISMV